MRRSYAGGVPALTVTAPVADIDLSIPVSTLVGVPTGSNGPFAVIVGKGTANEEKMLVDTASGGALSITTRGYDGTSARGHQAGEEVRLVGTAIDLDEANGHVNATQGVHGLAPTDAVAGFAKSGTFTNKTIDGDNNTIRDLKLSLNPEFSDALDDEEAARVLGDNARYTKTESDALYETQAAAAQQMDDHLAAVDPHPQYLSEDPLVPDVIPRDSLPMASRMLLWTGPMPVDLTANDTFTFRDLVSVTVPAVPDPRNYTDPWRRLLQVSFNIKGFTTNGADGDIVRFSLQLLPLNPGLGEEDLFIWPSMPAGENPQWNFSMPGNVSVGRNGFSATKLCTPDLNGIAFTVRLTKISGSCNVTALSDLSSLDVAQLL